MKLRQRKQGRGSQTGGEGGPSSVRCARLSVHPPERPLSLEEGPDAGVLGAL